MADWKNKRLYEHGEGDITSDGSVPNISESAPYRDGDYWAVTVMVPYDYILNLESNAGLTQIDSSLSSDLLYPGITGGKNAIVVGLQVLGKAFTRSPVEFYDFIMKYVANQGLVPGTSEDLDPKPLKERHLLINGPIIDTRPYGKYARYQIGVHKYLIEGWDDAVNFKHLDSNLDIIFKNIGPPSVPELSLLNSPSDLQASLDFDEAIVESIASAQEASGNDQESPDPIWTFWAPQWPVDPAYSTAKTAVVLGENIQDKFKPLEVKFRNLAEFEENVETLSLHLTQRQQEHEELDGQRWFYRGTETVVDFNVIANILRDCAYQIKLFMNFNNGIGAIDKGSHLSLGWWPSLDSVDGDVSLPDKEGPMYNPDKQGFFDDDFLSFGLDREITRNDSVYQFPNSPGIVNTSSPATFTPEPFIQDYQGNPTSYKLFDVHEGNYARYIEEVPVANPKNIDELKNLYWVRIEYFADDVLSEGDKPIGSGWILSTSLKEFVPPTPEYVNEYKFNIQKNGYLAYIRTDAKELVDLKKIKKDTSESQEQYYKRLNFRWEGFSSFLETKSFQNKAAVTLLKAMPSINGRSGNDFDALKFQVCRGMAKPFPGEGNGKERLTFTKFIKTYVGTREIELRPYDTPSDWKAVAAWWDNLGEQTTFSETKPDVDWMKSAVSAKGVRYVVANRNRNAKSMVGDALMQALPANVDRIGSWSDAYAYALNRIDIPTLIYKLMDCIHAKYSLNDILEKMCDSLLQEVDVDLFFEKFQEYIKEYSYIDTPLADKYDVQLVDPYQLMQDIKSGMADIAASGLNDDVDPETGKFKNENSAFYKATIQAIGDNPNNRMFICELIIVGIFGLGYLLYSAIAASKDIDPDDAIKLSDEALKSRNSIAKGCGLPWLKLPKLVTVDKWMAFLLKQMEKKLYQWLEDQVWQPLNSMLQEWADSCPWEDEADYGAIQAQDIVPDPESWPEIGQKTGALGIEDPEMFLSSLLATLTAAEICNLVDGLPSTSTLIHIKTFMQREYPNSYELLNTDQKIISFFKDLGTIFDMSVCLEDRPSPSPILDDFCKDGETPRQTAIRRSLAQKGLSPAEIEAQMEIDKALLGEQVGNILKLATLGPGSSNGLDTANKKAKSFASEIMAKSDSVQRQVQIGLNSFFEPPRQSFVSDIGTFIPSIFSEIVKLRQQGLEVEKLPFMEILKRASDPGYESSYYNSLAGLNRQYMWSPRLEFIPGTLDMDPASPMFGNYIPDTAKLERLGSKYNRSTSNPGHSNLIYEALDPVGDNLDVYNFRIFGKKPAETAAGYSTETLFEILEAKNKYPENLGLFADMFLNEFYSVLSGGKDIPYQVRLLQFLFSMSITRYNQVASQLSHNLLQPYNKVYGDQVKLLGSDAAAVAYFETINSNYFAKINQQTAYNSPSTGQTQYNTNILSIVYDQIVESYNKKIAEVTSNSSLFDLDRLQDINFYDSEDVSALLDLANLKQQAADKAQEYMMQIDLEGGEEPTYFSDAAFEGLIQALVKLYVVELAIRCIYMFSRFRIEDVFSDDIMSKFIKDRITKAELPDGSIIKDVFEAYLLRKAYKLRIFLKESKSRPVPSDADIESQVLEKVYNNKESADKVFDQLVADAMKVAYGEKSISKVIEEVLKLQLSPLEQEVVEYEKLQPEDAAAEMELQAPVTPTINSIVVGKSDTDWHGLENYWINAHKTYVYTGPEANVIDEYENIGELLGLIKPNTGTTPNSAAAYECWPGPAPPAGWIKLEPSQAETSCLREQILSTGPADTSTGEVYVQPVEVPIGVDLFQGGTTWDPGEQHWVELQEPIVKDIFAYSDLDDGWDIEVKFDFATIQEASSDVPYKDGPGYVPSGAYSKTEATLEEIDEWQDKILNEFGLMGAGFFSEDVEFQYPSSGFIENILGYLTPWELGAYIGNFGAYITQEQLDEHNWQITSTDMGNRKAKFRVRSAWAAIDPLEVNTHPAFKIKRNSGISDKVWGNIGNPSVHTTLHAHSVPRVARTEMDSNITEDVWESNHTNAVDGLKYKGYARYRIIKKEVLVPTEIVVKGYTAESLVNTSPKKGVIPEHNYLYSKRTVKVLQEIITHQPVAMSAIWDMGLADQTSTVITAGTYAGPQKKEAWQALAASDTDASQYPLIQIRPPVIWFNVDNSDSGTSSDKYTESEVVKSITGEGDQGYEIFVPEVKNFKLTVGGSGFNEQTKAYLQPVGGFGASYPFDIISNTSTSLELEMPIEVYLGQDDPPDFAEPLPGWQSPGNHEFMENTGAVLKMNGVKVEPDFYVLIVENFGKRSVGNVYFHTYHNGADSDHSKQGYTWSEPVKLSDSSTQLQNYNFNTEPEIPATFQVQYLDEIAVASPTRAYNLSVYPIETELGLDSPELWDVVDVPEPWGIHREQIFTAREPSFYGNNVDYIPDNDRSYRQVNYCEPRIDEKYDAGGFLLEKYVRIKFKGPADVLGEENAKYFTHVQATNIMKDFPGEFAVMNKLYGLTEGIKDFKEQSYLAGPSADDWDPFEEWGSIYEWEMDNTTTVSKSPFIELNDDDMSGCIGSGAWLRSFTAVPTASVYEHPKRDFKSYDLILSYSAFAKLMNALVGLKPEFEEESFYVYDVEYVSTVNTWKAMAKAVSKSLSLDPSPRICIDFPGFNVESENCHEEIVYESIQDFIEKDSKIHPDASYTVEPYQKSQLVQIPINIGAPMHIPVKWNGHKIIRSKPIWDTVFSAAKNEDKAAYSLLASSPWSVVLEDFAYGLRLAYVLPNDKRKYGSSGSETRWHAFEPKYNETASAERHSVDIEIQNLLNPWVFGGSYATNQESVFSGDSENLDHDISYINDKEVLLMNPANGANQRNAMYSHKVNHVVEADKENTDHRDVFSVPLLSVELGPQDADFPEALRNAVFTQLADGFPEANPAASNNPFRRYMYETLYKKLRTNSKFKLLFDYIIPSKRILAWNAIYNIMNFEQFFTDKCALSSVFQTTRSALQNSVMLTQKFPAGDNVDPETALVNPDMQKKINDMITEAESTDVCSPSAKALADFINRDKS